MLSTHCIIYGHCGPESVKGHLSLLFIIMIMIMTIIILPLGGLFVFLVEWWPQCRCVGEGDKGGGTCSPSPLSVSEVRNVPQHGFHQRALSARLESVHILSAPSWNWNFKSCYLQ